MTPNYPLYEQLKRAWIDAHPYATSSEYDSAIALIAKRCGV